MTTISYIILASGKGQRFGGDVPKQFCKLKNKLILEYSLDFFYSFPDNRNVILVLSPEYSQKIAKFINLNHYPNLKVIKGGETRQQSVYFALNHVSTKHVVIHDSARPLLNDELYQCLFKELTYYDAVVPVKKNTNTLYELDQEKMTLKNIADRNSLFQVETPQLFRTELIKKAHQMAQNENKIDFTDDGQMIKYYGLAEVKCLISKKNNLKITTEDDLKQALNILK